MVALMLAACGPAPERQAASIVAPPAVVVVAPDVNAVPRDPHALREWLGEFTYRRWRPQTVVRATGQHGGERLYFNDALTESMRAGAAEHPIGSAAVRELYEGDLATLKGFAVMLKTGPSGVTGEGWYWYEIFATDGWTRPTVAQAGAPGCVGCHSHATDFVHSPDTPREDPQPML